MWMLQKKRNWKRPEVNGRLQRSMSILTRRRSSAFHWTILRDRGGEARNGAVIGLGCVAGEN